MFELSEKFEQLAIQKQFKLNSQWVKNGRQKAVQKLNNYLLDLCVLFFIGLCYCANRCNGDIYDLGSHMDGKRFLLFSIAL